jgi:hypothetical protein
MQLFSNSHTKYCNFCKKEHKKIKRYWEVHYLKNKDKKYPVYRCREHRRKYSMLPHVRNKRLEKNKTQKMSIKTKYRCLLQSSKRKKLNLLEFNIDIKNYEQLLKKGCFYCGIILTNIGGASLDRIDNDIGYTIQNVVPCCGDCNKVRGAVLTVEETKIAIKAILDYRSKCAESKAGGKPIVIEKTGPQLSGNDAQ